MGHLDTLLAHVWRRLEKNEKFIFSLEVLFSLISLVSRSNRLLLDGYSVSDQLNLSSVGRAESNGLFVVSGLGTGSTWDRPGVCRAPEAAGLSVLTWFVIFAQQQFA